MFEVHSCTLRCLPLAVDMQPSLLICSVLLLMKGKFDDVTLSRLKELEVTMSQSTSYPLPVEGA